MTTRTIKVDYLARVEGEGALKLSIRNGKVEEAKLSIFEAPRFYEAFLRDRNASEAPDITARICGICPVAYQLSAVAAVENAASVVIPQPLRDLRRLLMCGEWISSHVLHIIMLHAPDFLNYPDAMEMARDHGDIVRRGLELKKVGNAIMSLIGGREIHPVNVRVGGFYRVPTRKKLDSLTERLMWACDAAEETVRWTADLPFPDYSRSYEYVALQTAAGYPLEPGTLQTSSGLSLNPESYEENFTEEQKSHSTALYSKTAAGQTYFVGPMARFALNRNRLNPRAAAVTQQTGLHAGCDNPFQSIIVRSIEVLHACEEALSIIRTYERPDLPFEKVEVQNTTGFGIIEAPRGLLYQRYKIGENGVIEDVKIVPPTAQNQAIIEEDLKDVATRSQHLSDSDLQWRCEQTIRNYDPCISCATHFLTLDIDRQ
ncbi:MAG: Ni/Fe hydrogenase subunit alpha [Rhodospirillaceae bacterium]